MHRADAYAETNIPLILVESYQKCLETLTEPDKAHAMLI